MNMLLNSVPESLTIFGTEYKINTDFRIWIKFELLLSDNSDDATDVLLKIKKLIFVDKIPPAHFDEETTEQILWFYRCGKDPQGSSRKSHEVFSYDYDDGYISAAFMEQYHIDLGTINLHWWKFHAYMLSLSDNTEFVKIMGYRAIEINSKMSSEQKNFYQKMKKHFRLPMKKELQQRNNELEERLMRGEDIDDLILEEQHMCDEDVDNLV